MTDWRDLAGELTDEQIAELEDLDAGPEAKLNAARVKARSNALQVLHADIPAPAGAVEIDPWASMGSEPAERTFAVGPKRDFDGIHVQPMGTQYSDGREKLFVLVGEDELSPKEAREFALAILDAVDDIEQAAG